MRRIRRLVAVVLALLSIAGCKNRAAFAGSTLSPRQTEQAERLISVLCTAADPVMRNGQFAGRPDAQMAGQAVCAYAALHADIGEATSGGVALTAKETEAILEDLFFLPPTAAEVTAFAKWPAMADGRRVVPPEKEQPKIEIADIEIKNGRMTVWFKADGSPGRAVLFADPGSVFGLRAESLLYAADDGTLPILPQNAAQAAALLLSEIKAGRGREACGWYCTEADALTIPLPGTPENRLMTALHGRMTFETNAVRTQIGAGIMVVHITVPDLDAVTVLALQTLMEDRAFYQGDEAKRVQMLISAQVAVMEKADCPMMTVPLAISAVRKGGIWRVNVDEPLRYALGGLMYPENE